MDVEKKIKVYEEVSELKRHFQKQILEKILSKIERIKLDDDDEEDKKITSAEYSNGELSGFNESKKWAQDIINREILKIK